MGKNMESKQAILIALQKCKDAQKQLKKRQQHYCIRKYYEKKEAESKQREN